MPETTSDVAAADGVEHGLRVAAKALSLELSADDPPSMIEATKPSNAPYRPKHIDILGYVALAVAIAELGVAFWGVTERKDSSVILMIAGASQITLFLAVGLVGFLAWNYRTVVSQNDTMHDLNEQKDRDIDRITAARDEAKAKLDNAVENQRAALVAQAARLAANDLGVANQFHRLAQRRAQFGEIVTAYLLDLTAPNLKRRMDAEKLDRELKELMVAICDTAAIVISARKNDPKPCSANLKFFVAPNEPNDGTCYLVLARSNNSDSDRYILDAVLSKNPLPVQQHKIYHDFFYGTDDDTDALKDHAIYGDVEKLIEAISQGSAPLRFKEPRADCARFYKSFISVPVYGASDHLTHAAAHQTIAMKSAISCGVFCIDSPETDYFNTQYDLKTMKELSVYVFDCMRAYLTVIELIRRLPPATPA